MRQVEPLIPTNLVGRSIRWLEPQAAPRRRLRSIVEAPGTGSINADTDELTAAT
jgi:hypothetical protein